MTAVCETVTGQTMRELRDARDRVAGADLVEVRLDGVTDVDAAGAVAGRKAPIVVTCRPIREGGRFDGPEETRLALLGQAARAGAEYIDVEWSADRMRVELPSTTKRILSFHDVVGVPADLSARVRAMRAAKSDVLKVAVTAKRLADCLALRDAVAGGDRHVAIAMGASGRFTRAWPAWTGSCWMYSGSAAPGQFSTRDLVDVYRVRETTTTTAIYAIAGAPLAHSASPAMHNAAFRAERLDAVYLPLESPDVDDFLSVAEAIGVRGASVTAPLKRDLAARCSAADLVTTSIGAVNTLTRSGDGWVGRNCDVDGFLAPFDRRGGLRPGERALVLGAGGAARAVVWALGSRGLAVQVSARRRQAAEALCREFEHATVGTWPPNMADWTLLVNTTPVGGATASEKALPIAIGPGRARTVYDLVYNPPETPLLAAARAAGAQAMSGLDMLVEQAALQWEGWTRRRAPREIMMAAAREFLRQ